MDLKWKRILDDFVYHGIIINMVVWERGLIREFAKLLHLNGCRRFESFHNRQFMTYDEAKTLVDEDRDRLIKKWSVVFDNSTTDFNSAILIESQEKWVIPEYMEEQKRLQEARKIVNNFNNHSVA